MRDRLLALGLVLSTASQFRLPGVPLGLGPGEMLLAIWILLALADATVRPLPSLTPALSRLLIFWTLFAFAQSVGAFVGLATEHFQDTAGALRTAKAYALAAALSCLIVTVPSLEQSLRRICWTMVTVGAVALTVLIAGAHGGFRVPGIDFWIFNRFVGWSLNPNQFALLCTVLVLLSLHLAETEPRLRAKVTALICGMPALVGGTLTLSDSFLLAMLVVGPMFLGIKILIQAFQAERRPTLRTSIACLLVFAVPAVLAAAAPFTPKLIDHADQAATATMEQNDQAEGRFRLWRDAVDIGLGAGMLGLGPGPHLVSKQWKIPPPGKNEAHNTVLDLFTQGGLLATAIFLWICAVAFLAAYRTRLIGLATLVVALLVFSAFHLIIRHPVFWFSIALCLAMADIARAASTAEKAPATDRPRPGARDPLPEPAGR